MRRVILTASGGPFRSWLPEQMERASLTDVLQHPTWRMGRKITVDSATLANKALEVIEAHYLFGLAFDQIDVVVHPQSVVHSFVEFVDGSVLAQLGVPSMELPVLYALTHPQRVPDTGVPPFDPVEASPMTFERVRHDDFPALTLGFPLEEWAVPPQQCSTHQTKKPSHSSSRDASASVTFHAPLNQRSTNLRRKMVIRAMPSSPLTRPRVVT